MSGVERKRSGAFGQWLLLVALLFGIATMHTVGHPAEHPPPGTAATVAHGGHPEAESAPTASSALPRPAAPDADAPPMSGMDPMAVCLAVLSTWAVALIALRLLGPRRAGPTHDGAAVRLPLAPWPNPPPRRTLLASLSVLRI